MTAERIAEVLAAHADCELNAAQDLGAVVVGLDAWSCGITLPFDGAMSLEDVERAHLAAAIAAALPDPEQAVREALDKVAGWANEWLADVREEQPTRRAREFDAILRGATGRCECNPAEVESGVCVKCGKPFLVGGSV